jgi:hypothetical protein
MLVVIFEGCHQANKKDDKTDNKALQDTSIDTGVPTPVYHERLKVSTFFDSVLNKYDLTWEQIKLNTILDSSYYNPNAVFTGDTIYNINKRSIVIVQYKIGVICEYKFIFIFQSVPMRNTDFKIFQTSCDIDPTEEGHVSSSFKIMNDIILVKEVSNQKVNGKSVKSTYKINGNGKIEANDSAK